ncbi:hypothetical protein DHC50_07090 [Arenibacter sp. A80]|nr:hypothetical protein [Arenibacter sp. A80]RFT57366.1 hypothetical protein D0S24_07085 [Arenibacter sp. P308M17]
MFPIRVIYIIIRAGSNRYPVVAISTFGSERDHFYQSILLSLITFYANIYLKEGTMQNKVLIINKILTIENGYILFIFDEN